MARKTIDDLVADGADQEAVDAIRGIARDIGEAVWIAAHSKSRTQAKDAFEAVADKIIVFALEED
jgi:hypothetical protein